MRCHAALLQAAGADRFVLDRLCLDGDTPLACEVERVRVEFRRARDAGQMELGV